jgi:hypothetical protein
MSQTNRACWLTPTLMVFLASLERGDAETPTGGREPQPWRVIATGHGSRSSLPTRVVHCGAGSGGGDWWLCSVLIDEPVPDETLDRLTVTDGQREREVELTSPFGAPLELAREIRNSFDPPTRGRVIGYLNKLATSYEIELTPELGASLHEIRDVLRPSLPQTRIAPGPLCARLEHVTAIDQRTFWLTGWIHEADPRQTKLVAVTPEGTRIHPKPGTISYHPRPAYAEALDDPETTTLGFHALIQTPNSSVHPQGWILEFQATNGRHIQDAAGQPADPDGTSLWEHITATLRANPDDTDILAQQVLPTLEHLRFNQARPQIERVMTFGRLPERPIASIVIAVRRLDRIEHQLGQFARDPQLTSNDVELIYVTPPGTAEETAAEIVEQLQALYDLPLRLVVLSRPAPRARALNLGASEARGEVLVLLSGDLLPAATGWVSTLMNTLTGSAQIGAVAPKLLREDGSIAHAGARYVRRQSDRRWHRTLPLAGYAGSIPAADHGRQIQAGSDACLVLESSWFEELDGFSELYLGEGDEAGDLCLRLAARGLQTWYEPNAELYLLDRPDAPRDPSPLRDPFNAWLLEHRCGAALGAQPLDGDKPTPPTPSRRTQTAGALSDSGRPGPAIEQLELIAGEDDPRLLSGSLMIPVAGAGRLPYEGTYAFAIEGRALARDGSSVNVEVRTAAFRGYRAAANLPSPELAHEHADVPGSDQAGYHVVVSTLGLPTEFELKVHAVTADGARSSLGRIRGHRRPLRTGFEPKIQPLMVTMLGRTGSTWLMALLSRHPQIISYSPFVYEPMLAGYWTTILQKLGDPASYTQSILAELDDDDWWLGRNRTPPPREKPRTEMMRWLGRENVEVIASFAQNRLDEFYREAARVEGRVLPRFFAEKCVPGATPRLIAELYPEGREIVLVRDMRDRFCSIRAYNAKRGLELWGRDSSGSDEEWFDNLREQGLRLLHHWRERSDSAYLLRYEDLIHDPHGSLEALLSYVGVDHSDATIERTRELAEEMLPGAQRDHQTSSSIESSIGRWRDELTPNEQAACAKAFDDLLIEFGYEPTAGAASDGGSSASVPAPAAGPGATADASLPAGGDD